jgi:hypothetical protein
MQKFYYNTVDKLRVTQAALNLVTVKYTSRDFDTDTALIQFLTTTSVAYKEIGNKDRESQLLTLKAEFLTAQRGINPITFEKITIRRNEMVNTICFKILQAVEQFMRTDLQQATQILDAAKEIVTQIIIAGLQAGIITDVLIEQLKTQEKIESLWKLLSTDANIAIGQKRVLLQVSKYDVWFLIDELITGLKK